MLFCERYDAPAFDPAYDTMPLEAFEPMVRRMIDGGGVWVLIGHSNTVPDLVRRLGGDAGTDAIPDSVYDQIFMVVRAGTGTMTVPLHS